MRQKLWRKKKFVVMAAAFACIAALSACGKKDTDYNVDVGNGDGGSVQSKYSIPESCDTTFDAGSTGLKEIRLTDSDITVPNTGAMYVAPVKMKEIDPEYRKNLGEKLFDTDKGVYVYYDMENMDKLSKEDIQEYIDLYEQQKKADPSNAANYDSDIDRMNRLLQTTSKQRENAGDYSADEYMGTVGDLEYRISFPQEGEMNGNGTTAPGLALPGETPWRTITLGETLAPIVETTVSFDVVKPLYEVSGKYEYGRGSWSWIIGMDGSTKYEEQLRYIDFSAAMGYQSVLVDALWDTQIGYDKVEKLAKYGAEKGVGLYLWYNSNGYWNDAPQSPRGIMDNAIARRKEMKWMQSIGIRGIKVDFFGGDKQVTMQLYEDILADANEYGLLVIFHGCTLPRGWERMYPNFASSEAVLASENLHFSQGSCDNEAFNACLHPFIRNTVGSMDFGGSALNKYYNADNAPRGNRRMTSDVFALATAVLFQSPVQHFALAPNNLTDAPEWAIGFMKEVPTTWDEVRFIDGYPGKYVVMARRHGDKWYVAGVNAQKETVKLKIALTMFMPGDQVRVFTDNEELQGNVKQIKVNKKQELQLAIPCNGGILIVE